MADNKDQSTSLGALLIIEDEVNLRDIMVEMLSPIASNIYTAGNGLEGLELLHSQKVDAVLTDIRMPLMTGLEFLSEVRKAFNQVPVVILSAFSDEESLREALRLDATDFLVKPFDQEKLLSTMTKALSYGQALRELDSQLDSFYKNSKLPADEIAKHKKYKKIVQGMKVGFSVYTKKSA